MYEKIKKEPYPLFLLLLFLLILIALGFSFEIGYRIWLSQLRNHLEVDSSTMPALTKHLLSNNLGLHNYYIMFSLMISFWWPFVLLFSWSVYRYQSIERIQSLFYKGSCVIWLFILLVLICLQGKLGGLKSGPKKFGKDNPKGEGCMNTCGLESSTKTYTGHTGQKYDFIFEHPMTNMFFGKIDVGEDWYCNIWTDLKWDTYDDYYLWVWSNGCSEWRKRKDEM